jgi:hypothetical protein
MAGQVDPLIQGILTSSIRSNRCLLGGSHSSKVCSWERRCIGPSTSHGARPIAPGRAGRTCQADRTCRAGRAWWFGRAYPVWHVGSNFSQNVYLPMKFLTTQLMELLLVLKMCMKLFIYSSRTRGFDGRFFVVRTVNTSDDD